MSEYRMQSSCHGSSKEVGPYIVVYAVILHATRQAESGRHSGEPSSDIHMPRNRQVRFTAMQREAQYFPSCTYNIALRLRYRRAYLRRFVWQATMDIECQALALFTGNSAKYLYRLYCLFTHPKMAAPVWVS